MHKRIAAGWATGALVLGAGGVAIMLPSLVAAADPTSSPSATSPTATTAPTNSSGSDSSNSSGNGSTTTNPADCAGMGGPGMGSDDITAAAAALGMSEADVTAALQNGQTLADLAAKQNVDVQTVIDAMVATEKAEIQAKVDDGTITQAQADQMIGNLTQHETDEVNGTFHGDPGGPGGRGGRGGFHGQPPSGTAPSDGTTPTTPSTTTPSTTSDSTSS